MIICYCMICLNTQVRVQLSCFCLSDMYPLSQSTYLLSGIIRCSRVISILSFPHPSPGFIRFFREPWFLLNTYRSQVFSIGFAHCYWGCCSRPFQQTELGNTCLCDMCVYTHVNTHTDKYILTDIYFSLFICSKLCIYNNTSNSSSTPESSF